MNEIEKIYEKVIEQSQENVNALSEKLLALDALYADIESLKDANAEIPILFEKKYIEIAELSQKYTNNIGASTKLYIDGNNKTLTKNIGKLADENINLRGISNDIEREAIRLENLDFKEPFDKFQKTLSDIFGAINTVNSSMTEIHQSMNKIVKSNDDILSEVENLKKELSNKILNQSDEIKKINMHVSKSIDKVLSSNNQVTDKIGEVRTILIIGLVMITILLIYMVFGK
jgi:uncharacterized coiled-coil protein SlyX